MSDSTGRCVKGGCEASGSQDPGTSVSVMQGLAQLESGMIIIGGSTVSSSELSHAGGGTLADDRRSHAGSPMASRGKRAMRFAPYSVAMTSPVGVIPISHGQLASRGSTG